MHISYIYAIYGQSICGFPINKVCSVYLIQKFKLASQLLLMHQRECLQSSEAGFISYIFYLFFF